MPTNPYTHTHTPEETGTKHLPVANDGGTDDLHGDDVERAGENIAQEEAAPPCLQAEQLQPTGLR